MAFLDNSGDIILDAVLTDTGRFRLAKGDGSFKISKFAFGDDEINYGNYNKNDSRGSAYYDLDILQSPILEAFTNNTSNMNSKLITIPRTNLLFLPVMALNTKVDTNKQIVGAETFYIAVDKTTSEAVAAKAPNNTISNVLGYIDSFATNASNTEIRIDQGLQTTEVPATFTLDPDLVETNYMVQLDHRLASLATSTGATTKIPRFIDDDNIAHYYLSSGADSDMISSNSGANPDNTANESTQVILGPRGTRLNFVVLPSIELASSTFLFTELGEGSFSWTPNGGTSGAVTDLSYIDTTVKITGVTTGYSIDVSLRFLKKTA